MSSRLAVPDDTRRRQHLASQPQSSAWVSANAGSGKTHVLTQRVLRLLLEGVPPSRILCLTFTKAAAANMSIRVFETLAHWTGLDDAALRTAIEDTGAPHTTTTGLLEARRLFARTVESPGGLKIQTIHAFCERLLHLFPFEANIPARFDVMDELMGADLLERARLETLAEAVAEPETPLGGAVAFLTVDSTAATFEALVTEALGHRARIAVIGDEMDLPSAPQDALARLLNLRDGETPASLMREMTEGGVPPDEWGQIARILGADGSEKDTAANRLAAAALAPEHDRLQSYLAVFLTAKQEPRSDRYLPAALRTAFPDLADRLDRERDRLVELLGRCRAAETRERTLALLTVAAAVLSRYEHAKQVRGQLDFDDLVARTRHLLTDTGSAWVLYKLDGGIDHVLVDEAQDTSPEQWDILRALTAEFFAGDGQSRAVRTFFAVGDEKQSIFSFQGARPAMFDAMHKHFAGHAERAEAAFAPVALNLSFRSAQAVLETVDRVFAVPSHARGLSATREPLLPHEPLKRELPGLVQLWPALGPEVQPEPRDWRLPVDQADPKSPPILLAQRVAQTIAALTAVGSGETVADGAERRPVRPGDVLVLVRSRNAFFEAVIRALKDKGVPVAGADRLVLTEHIAVMDLVAAGRASLLPEDDLTVACVLKSPLIGLDDEDLIALAPHRRRRLIDALAESEAPRHRAAADLLAIWRERVASLSPFAFFARLLGADGGRKKLVARLGVEASDAIDEFLALALVHEREGPPSLLAFLTRLEGETLSIKRDMEAAGDAVRVMTVHAAKGLEAKIVFLPDTCSAPTGRHDPKLFVLGADADDPASGHLAWSPRKDLDPGPVAAARAALREAAIEEHNRLLYVALTRAEERLYVGGFFGSRGMAEGCWYAMLAASDLGLSAAPAPWDPHATVQERRDPGLLATGTVPSGNPGSRHILPAWLRRHPPREIAYAPPLRPSNALGAADQQTVASEGFDAERDSGRRHAMLAGRLVHKLLQHLPTIQVDARVDAAHRLAAAYGGGLDLAHTRELIGSVFDVMTLPDLQDLFGAGARAEVALAGRARLGDGRTVEITGQIDRICVTDTAVLIADFKTGRAHDLASTPQAYVAQLALYRAAVAPLYPGKAVRAFLVWTSGPAATEVPEARLDAALAELAAG